MDSRSSAQGAVYCGLCETALVQMYCDTCLTNLCTACVGKHVIMDEPRGYQVGIFQSRTSGQHPNKCPSHSNQNCKVPAPNLLHLHWFGMPLNHIVEDIHKILEFRKKKAARDQKLILNSLILPSFQTMAQKIQNEWWPPSYYDQLRSKAIQSCALLQNCKKAKHPVWWEGTAPFSFLQWL